MEQVILADKEDGCEFFEVVSHHSVFRRALAEVQQSMNVFHTSKGFLPKLQFDGDIELLKSSV